MFIIRPIATKDIASLHEMALVASGMMSLPRNPSLLEERIHLSQQAFSKTQPEMENESYLFVLEDTLSGSVGGVCGIEARQDLKIPMFFFRIEAIEDHLSFYGKREINLLKIFEDWKAHSKICSLYLLSRFRKFGLGRLLSLSRFLFIASHPQRFHSTIFGEMRGRVGSDGKIPFWEGIGKHFLNVEIEELRNLKETGKLSMHEWLPPFPIYTKLLPKEIQSTIGCVHDDTRPALNMLLQEGFLLTSEIDIFDGGPKVEAKIEELKTVKNSLVDTIAEIVEKPRNSPRYLLCNNKIEFRACIANLEKTKADFGLSIDAETAKALHLNIGDSARYTLL